MAYNFQEPLFLHPQYTVPAVATSTVPVYPLTWAWVLSPTTTWTSPPILYTGAPRIKIRVIFYGSKDRPGRPPGFWTATTVAIYDNPPDRKTVLESLSYWSAQEGLEDEVYAGQAKFILTSSCYSTLSFLPDSGPQIPRDHVSTIELRDDPPSPQFEIQMADIRARQLGAFLLVDVDAHSEFVPSDPAEG